MRGHHVEDAARGLDARFVDQPLYLKYRVEDGELQVKNSAMYRSKALHATTLWHF
jgi:hypothetical protein